MELQLKSLWVLVLTVLIACTYVHAATPYSFYEFESKDFISSNSRPVKLPDGNGLSISMKNIVGTCNINETIYIATDSSVYKMVNPSKFVKIIDVSGITRDLTCGEQYLFHVASDKASIRRIDLISGTIFSFVPTYISNRVYKHIKGLSYRNGYLYFTHWDQVTQVSGINSVGYQLWFEKILIDGTGMQKLYTADTSNLESNGGTVLYKALKSLYIKTSAGDVIYSFDNIGISLYVDTDETIYFMIDGDYSMTKQKRVYKIAPSPTDAELIAWCSYGEVYDVDGDATNSKCGPLSSYFTLNSKKYFLSNNNIKSFTGDATTGTISTFLSFEKNLVSATQLNSKNLIVAESNSVYLIDLDLLTSTKIAGGDVENIGDYDSYKNAYFNNINKIAKKGNFLYIAEGNGKRIRKVDLVTNIITTVASIAPYFPRTLSVDDNGILYCMATDGGRTFLLKITQTGSVTIPFGGASTAGSDASSASQCWSSCFWGELKFGGFSSKTQSMYAIQVASSGEYLCKHSATNQAKSCNKLGDLSNVGARFVFNVAVAGDFVYVLKKNLIVIYTLDLVWAGEIYPAFNFAATGSSFYISDREQAFVTDPTLSTFYTVFKNKGYLSADSSINTLMGGASDLLLLDDGSIMYVHSSSNSIKILSPKSCISAISGIDFAHKCEIQCNGKYVSDESVCNGRGQCAYVFEKGAGSSVCKCRTGLSGSDCETVTCPDCQVKCFDKLTNDSSICSGHGSCVSLDKCSCSPNYSGNQCQYTTCNGISNTNSTVCSGNGVCSGFDTCTCNSGFNGSNCEQTTCFGISNSDASVCGGHGKCVALDTCKCQNGYSGSQCQSVSCFGIPATNPLVCSGHGTCSKPDTCTCTNSFTGSNCDLTTCGSMKSDNPDVCGSIDAGWCDSKDNCACKPGMVRTDSLTCKRPCGSCTGFSANKQCKSVSGVSYCSPVSCSSPNAYAVTNCTSNGMYYCAAGGVCAFECASDSDCTNEYRSGKCESDSSLTSYRTCKKTCSSNSDCTARFPLCVDYGLKGSRCERKPCSTASNCTNPDYPYCVRSGCDNVECSADSDCDSVDGRPYCNKNGVCSPKSCLIASECTSSTYKHCSFSPLNGTGICSKVECTEDANCKNVNGRPVCSSNTCVAKSCSTDSECPQNGINKYCLNSQCKALYSPCVTSSDCSSYLDTPTCNTTLNVCVPTVCKYSKYCPDAATGCRVTSYSAMYGNSTKVCAIECENDSHCSNTPGRPDCEKNVCTERTCAADSDCPQDGANKYCKSGLCEPACLVDNDCYGTFNVCMAKNGYECANYNLNDICETSDDCPSKFGTCMTSRISGLMNCGKECIADTNCTSPSKPSCDFSRYVCKEKVCLGDYGCLESNWSPMCTNYRCDAECYNDFNCATRPGSQKCDTAKFKCITQTCTGDESCKSYGGGYFPHCVNGMCRHECTHDWECSIAGKAKCERPANANTTDGGICVAKSCSSADDCTVLGNRNSFCVNSVCNYECTSNADCKDKIDGKHVCMDNKCTNYCSDDQPCNDPWFSKCLSNQCFRSCDTGNECKSVHTPKCYFNNTNGGSSCVAGPTCSADNQCGSANDINYVYSKCMNSTCAFCLQNSDCNINPDRYYCGLDEEGRTVCTYQTCSTSKDCPGEKKCWKATDFSINSFTDPETKVCLDYNCETDADCSGTVNKHKCAARKCVSNCQVDSDCPLGSFPTCNKTSNDCTFKSCSSASDCTFGAYTNCQNGLCKPECESHHQCAGRDDDKTACVKGMCTNYCDANVTCTNPWFSSCLGTNCFSECSANDCKTVDRQLCVKNDTNNGARCVAANPCSQDSDCSNPKINFRYNKCISGTCAACKSSADCLVGTFPSQQFCSPDQNGYTVCNYKSCSTASDCPANWLCNAASILSSYNTFLINDATQKICIDGCLTDADCKGTVDKHKCLGNQCVANCIADYQCAQTPATPVCNTTIGDCTFKKCTTSTDCGSTYPYSYCRAGLCKTECDVNSDCTTAAKPRCDAGKCSAECTLDSHCNSTSACDTATSKCRIKLNECSTNADCSSTYNKHKCAAWKECVPFCTSNSSCTDAFRPYCNATGECELKPCFSNSDCGASYPICNKGTCDIECTTDSECKDPFKSKCTKNVCAPECTSNAQCGKNFCINTKCTPCSTDGICDGTKGCAVHLDGTKSCDYKLCNADVDCKGLLSSKCKPATTFGYSITTLTSNASATVCSPECTSNTHCTDPKYPTCNTKYGTCGAECASDSDCYRGNKKFCDAGTCSSCDQVKSRDACAALSKTCLKDASGTYDCALPKCTSNSDCVNYGLYSACIPYSKTQSAATFYPSTQTVCYYECSANPLIPCSDPNYPRCDSVYRKCVVECATSADCTSGKICTNNKCTTGCTDNSQCGKAYEQCQDLIAGYKGCSYQKCNSNSDCTNPTYPFCVSPIVRSLSVSLISTNTSQTVCYTECSSDGHCKDPSKPKCSNSKCVGQCSTDADCQTSPTTKTPFCKQSKCVARLCENNNDCLGMGFYNSECRSGTCQEQCLTSLDCPASNPICVAVSARGNARTCINYNNYCTSSGYSVNSNAGASCICGAGKSGQFCQIQTNSSCSYGSSVLVGDESILMRTPDAYTNPAYCNCISGYSGKTCNVPSRSQCDKACVYGQCVGSGATPKCACDAGYEGDLCDKQSTAPCTLKCVNGQCDNVNGIAKCICNPGFEGDLCDKVVPNPCTLKCINGQCNNATGIAKCVCNTGFEGELCEKQSTTPCTLQCVNGKCSNADGIPKCICNTGFEGILCDKQSANPCNLRCVNGQCNNVTGTAKCICNTGFEGELCEKQSTTPCTLQCVNGQCSNANGVQKCVCNAGFEGNLCEKKIANPCNLRCVSGQCNNVTGTAKCICNPGFEGELCDKVVPNPCTLKCVNGLCSNTTGLAKCMCTSGYEGELCEKQSCNLKCAYGQCAIVNGAQKCVCNTGFEGVLCDTKIPNPCTLKCVNGQCANTTGLAKCVCSSGYEGDLCDTRICSRQCLNGGSCKFNAANSQVCSCINGYTGAMCQISPDAQEVACKLTCLNGGVCMNTTGIAKCLCTSELFVGDLCSSCKTGFILQKGVCVCPYGFNNENGNCIRLPADCSGGCGQYGQCLYKDTTGYQGYCKCQENYVTELSTKPCGACISGYVLNAQGKCVKVCPPEFTGDDCTTYVPAATCVPIPPSGLSFCKAHLQGFKVLNTHYASGAANATDARLLITNAMTQLDKSAKSLYDLNIAMIQKQGVCNSTCEESNARLACYSVIQSCNSPASPETKLCKSVCNYIVKDIRTYYPDFESPCSNLEDTSCFYGAYLPPDTSCYGKLYTDSAVCGGRGDCVGTDKCICKSGFSGSQCTSAVCFGKSADQADVCSGNGACSGPNRCSCNSGYTGLECNVVTCNGKSENEGGCSYRGVCSSVTRACVCNGNFAGSSCLKCKEGFTGPQCDIPVCNGISAIDRSVCGGRGTCKSEDGVPKCQCNDGYDGSNCQTFVCNGTDRLSPNVCSSKGRCVSYDTCSCESKNFNPATYCSTCLPSFDGANCENKKCTPEETCRGRGSCDSQFKCVCSDKFTGPFCERCVDGFVGDQCQYKCSPDTCNRRGTCANDGSCICSDNASGANCETCKPGWFGDKCDFSVDASSFGFSENGDSITGTVMTSLRKRIDCSSLIVNSQLLGTNPVCSLNGEKSLLTITLGTSSSISIGGILTVRKYFESELTSNVIVAQLNYKAISPVAALVADKSTISKACGAIYLDASGSSSLDRRSLIYSWTTTVAPSSTEVLDSIISKQTTPGVKFTASDLDVGTYVVQVTVKSSFSLKESVASVTFNVIAATPPTISIKNGLESSMVIGSPYIISPIVTFPSCYKGSGSLVYTYTLESGSPLVLKQKNELLVFSNDYTQLTEEGDYVFKLSAKEEGSPEATVTFKVTATALPLKVAFNIRDMTQSFEDPVSFAITKQDPSNPNEAGGQVSISCANIDTASSCDGFVDGAQNIDQTTLKLQQKMSAGVYSFTATYTKSTRTSTASVKVTVSDQSKSTVLRVSISVPKDADLVAIDPSSDLILQATSLDTLTSARLFTWSSSDFTFDASIDISKQYIVIPKSLLAPGASYTVTVKVVDGQKSGEATLSFTVNSPPTMGTLDISPKSGIAVTDEFKISCGNGWSDPQLPLTFAFYSKASTDTNWKLLKEKSETRSFGTSLPAGELQIKVVVFDSKGASTETTTSVSVSLPTDTASALTSLSSGTMTTSSVSSALSLLETAKSDDPEQMKQFAELGKQIVLSYFEQKATEESLSSQTSTSTSSTLSVISSISSCVNNLPDDTIRMIIEKFKSATNGASTSSSISLSDEEIKSSTDSASTIQTYVSGSLAAKRSLFASSFTLEDLNKIDQVKNNLMNIKLKNAVPDMPAVRGTGIKSLSYVRLVNIASLNGLFESLAENGVTSFNLSSVFSEIPQVSSLDSVKISMKVYENSNTTFKSTSKIFDFVVASSDNTNVVIKYSKPIAQLIIEKANSSARAVQEPKCNSVVDGAITESSSCTILGTNPDSYVIAVSSTGSYVIGTTSSTDVQPGTSTTTETPTTPTKPITNAPNLDYIALILLIIPVILIIVGIVGVIVYVLRRKKIKEHAAPSQNYELKSTV